MAKETIGVVVHLNIEADLRTMTRKEACELVRSEITSREVSDGDVEFVTSFGNMSDIDVQAFDQGKCFISDVMHEAIKKLKDRYSGIECGYWYSEFLNTHYILHDNEILNGSNITEEENEFLGNILFDIMNGHGIYNTCIYYCEKGKWNEEMV